ncbi:MAG: DinB family protein [Candidatus Bathyarchaeota archaeon]|jgi:uncharacterized damage-inducible protein DinB
MSQKIEMLKAFAETGFSRLGRAIKDLNEEQLDWRSCPEANTLRWILTHLSHELHVFVPMIITGNREYTPEGWPEDYVDNPDFTLEKIVRDLEEGKDKLMDTLDSLGPHTLEEEIDWFIGKQPKTQYILLAISEIHHHEGQIAAILGLKERMGEI